MKKNSLTIKIMAGILAALMIVPIVATAIIYFLH